MTSAKSRWSEVKAAATEALDLPATDRHAYLDTRLPDPARVLVHLNSTYRFGARTLFARVENLFGERYVAKVRANEILGRFYEAGSSGWVSVGVSVTGWGPAQDTDP